ncbi:MAG: hypothetical protein WCF03_18185 [Nitrososphaeraceae archaeon]
MSEIQEPDDNNNTSSSKLLKYDFREANIKKNARRCNRSYQGWSYATLDDSSSLDNLGDRNIS